MKFTSSTTALHWFLITPDDDDELTKYQYPQIWQFAILISLQENKQYTIHLVTIIFGKLPTLSLLFLYHISHDYAHDYITHMVDITLVCIICWNVTTALVFPDFLLKTQYKFALYLSWSFFCAFEAFKRNDWQLLIHIAYKYSKYFIKIIQLWFKYIIQLLFEKVPYIWRCSLEAQIILILSATATQPPQKKSHNKKKIVYIYTVYITN